MKAELEMWKSLVIVVMLLLSFVCCQEKRDDEKLGQHCLSQAREAMALENYSLAKQLIDTLRKKYPMALNAREEAILLLDSVNLAEARIELRQWQEKMRSEGLSHIDLDTLDIHRDRAEQKVKFFEKKIDHDIAHRSYH